MEYMSFDLKVLDLPAVPDDLIRFPEEQGGFDNLGLEDRYLERNGEKFQTGRYLGRKPLDADTLEWVHANIIDDYQRIGYAAISAPCHGPHIDRNRLFVLQYVIDPGGPDVTTVFYEPKHQKVEIDHDWHCNNYDDLEVTRVYRIPPKKWCLINARHSLHSTEGITTSRKSIQIALIKNPF
jgi:hypothetical protein